MSYEELITSHMVNLKISREEAIQLIEDDKLIDKGAKLFELTEEQKKAEKEARSGLGENGNKGKAKTKERKVDTDKREIISLIKSALNRAWISTAEGTENKYLDIELVNDEREITFKTNVGDRKFKIVLSCPRT